MRRPSARVNCSRLSIDGAVVCQATEVTFPSSTFTSIDAGPLAGQTAGIDSSWRERAPIYNLYHLLNHLLLFGTS